MFIFTINTLVQYADWNFEKLPVLKVAYSLPSAYFRSCQFICLCLQITLFLIVLIMNPCFTTIQTVKAHLITPMYARAEESSKNTRLSTKAIERMSNKFVTHIQIS
jgi:hypothetical protein